MADIVVTEENAYKPITVELWGEQYQTRDMTRSAIEKVAAAEREFVEVQEDDADKALELLAGIFDARLVAANGKRTKPSTVIKRRWKDDKIGIEQLGSIIAQINVAGQMQMQESLREFAEGRPT